MILCLLCCCSELIAQTADHLERQFIGSLGGFDTNTDYQISHSVGDIVTFTGFKVDSDTTFYTQGFQQPPGEIINPKSPGICNNIPNAITPSNENGVNDQWDTGLVGCDLTIYDRWGRKVYSIENYQNDWRGIRDEGGKGRLPRGTYFYVLIDPLDPKNACKGTITVL